MNKISFPGGWYSFATLQGDWATLIKDSHIISSRGRIELPKFNNSPNNVLFLSGATINGQIVMAGQSHHGDNCMFYGLDKKWLSLGVAFAIQMVCFSQDGKFLYCISSGYTGFYVNVLTGEKTDFTGEFGVNGIRAIIPPLNKIIIGLQTIYSPKYRMNEYIDFENGFICGQIDQGYGAIYNNKRYLIRESDCFANKVMYDGFNIAYATTDRIQSLAEIIFCNVNELKEIETLVITPINRPHWFGFFTGKPGVLGGWDTNDDPPEFQDVHALPGNGYLDVPTATFYSDRDRPIGSFIHGGASVEEVEQAALNTQYLPIAYWDGRNWPRWPNLPEKSWLCLQAYCARNESFAAFEADIRAKLLDLSQNKPQQKIAIIAQSYWQTPVNSLTDDLSGLVPIFSRLAAEFPNVIATIPFNGNGRFSGMQHHPEIRPIWEQFAAGIIGEPLMSNPQLPPEICEAVIRERNKYDAVPMSHELAQILNDTAWQFRPDWGLSRKEQGNRVNSPNRPGLGNIASDILHRKSDNMIWDVLISAGEASTPNCDEALGPMTDPNRPWVAPVEPPNVLEPDIVSVVIQYHDIIAYRSDPNGMLIRFDCSSPNRIIEIECDLEGDEEPSIVMNFLNEERRDGRYCRALAFKPVRNGTWTLRVKAKDHLGNVGQSDGTHRVEVAF